ncbi:hypothetical protein SAMN06265375_101692 [Muriicola jejuensis]|uniref:Uncharacterized protein n=1 Tax=Muriicola jejuensis TaxID=504488 RepID=A0A6P0UD02_9FLAO|nr:hypothetical protein [Muriicola jejuensis]NER09789.1 hypothetical protein [Muriicola jejuensis]SMP05753.1 hypothetical protein SAMN06265375_101692 [Muriicola jejuensis]
MRKKILLFGLICVGFLAGAQEYPIDYTFGEKYNDRYKYSNLLTIEDDGKGGSLMVRAYYTGLILTPKGYLIEHYDENLQLISEYNYKLKDGEFVHGYFRNGQLYLLFLDYNMEAEAYEYWVHRSPIEPFSFTAEKLLSFSSAPVNNPLDKNYYNRNFNSGFSTTVLFPEDRNSFLISTHFKKGKDNRHEIYLYSSSLKQVMYQDFSAEVEEKNYAFERVEVSNDLSQVFIVGKAYFKKRRFTALERKFQYELIRLTPSGIKTLTFDSEGKYSESLTPLYNRGDLICVGFYADRKDNRYNGLSYFRVDPSTMEIKVKKYNPFTEQFMFDKFGQEYDKEVQNLVFKNATVTPDNHILFNAEEYFVTQSIQANSSGGRIRVERFHHNDIVSAKLDPNGNTVWARNINKSEVTQGDGDYASYSALTRDGKTYFFISTAAENPQVLNNERIIFKQGLSRNRNVFVIQLDGQGQMSYEKIIDSKDARLPLMVSNPLIDSSEGKILFYAKRGTKKQLVNVAIN